MVAYAKVHFGLEIENTTDVHTSERLMNGAMSIRVAAHKAAPEDTGTNAKHCSIYFI